MCVCAFMCVCVWEYYYLCLQLRKHNCAFIFCFVSAYQLDLLPFTTSILLLLLLLFLMFLFQLESFALITEAYCALYPLRSPRTHSPKLRHCTGCGRSVCLLVVFDFLSLFFFGAEIQICRSREIKKHKSKSYVSRFCVGFCNKYAHAHIKETHIHTHTHQIILKCTFRIFVVLSFCLLPF